MESRNEINIFEFNKMMNDSEIIYSKSERKLFVDVRRKGNLILFHFIRFYCRECDKEREECENTNMSVILDLIETILHRKLVIKSRRVIDSNCETNYYFLFLAE